MTFAAFMQLALYDAQHGFYTHPDRGPGADYQTSPELTPAFGELVAKQLEAMWQALDEQDEFKVLEIGGGRGHLAAAAAGFPLGWILVERSTRVRAVQEGHLGNSAAVTWRRLLDDGPSVVGVVLANEVLDNFPVHLCELTADGVCEVLIDGRGGELVEVLGPLSSPTLSAATKDPADHLRVGDRFEICLGLRRWCGEVSAALERGYLLVIDYGDTSPSIWTERPSGTLVSYRAEQLTANVLEDPGLADITAHVDFSRLKAEAESAGFTDATLVTQAEWLKSLGMDARVEAVKAAEKQAAAEGRHADAVSAMAERGRLRLLHSSPGFGDLKVFRAAKDAPAQPVVI